MKVHTYTVILKSQPEGGFTVRVPSLPGCITEGDSKREALNNAQDAIELFVEDLIADNELIPSEYQAC